MSKFFAKLTSTKPSMYSKSLFLNILGMQWYRILFFYLIRKVKASVTIKPEYKEYLKILERDGVIVIPNFLSEADYKEVLDEYQTLTPSFVRTNHNLLPRVDGISMYDKRVLEKNRNLFLKSDLIRSLVSSYLNRYYNLQLPIDYNRIYCNQEDLDKPRNGGTNNLHFDAPLRIVKIFYYLTDTTQENGALRYCKGSHKRNNLKRLLFEYKLSIRYSLNKWNKDNKGEYGDDEPWVTITSLEQRKYNLNEESIEAKGNSLVIFDVGGFHRRGDNNTLISRDSIQLNYRSIDTLRNYLFPFEKRIRSTIKSSK
ncbi:MAG: phytanoyl-CoA dioxygenase family protein [Candidatus Harrisonbacteria bacterium]|nr:phytanoyl-CoA dioxygenase family protein [Candidatus Harrisonbacteria bacterium]